jgi:hypothetical protein
MTYVILCWFMILKFVFQVPPLTLHFRYKYIWLQIDFISCILCIHALYHINMNNFC